MISRIQNRRAHRSERPRWNAERITGGAAAALGSIILHSMLFAPLLFGGRTTTHHVTPLRLGADASAQESSSALTAFFLNEAVSIDNKPAQLPALENAFLHDRSVADFLEGMAPPTVSFPAPEDDSSEQAATAEAVGDREGRAMLFGRYLGQITARVSRAWKRPRSRIASGSFMCRVQITQDTHGNVGEIEVRECTADVPWQLSLVHAIESASPLPAPPDPTLFSSTVTLDFDSAEYSPGANEDLFEAPARVANIASPP